MTHAHSRVSRIGYVGLIVALAIASSAGFSFGRSRHRVDDVSFPHARHAALFPTTCIACHAGIERGDSTAMLPPSASCADCHNGNDVKAVAWRARRAHPTNLQFDHVRHARRADSTGTSLSCQQCHGTGSPTQRMNVARARPETCVGCHAHQAPSHFAVTSPCATCHVTIARATALSDSAIAALPRPAWHDTVDFIFKHGVLSVQSNASCATCHVRESCARCHVNASTLAPIVALGSSARVARLAGVSGAIYPVPPSHRRIDFGIVHGRLARDNVQTCATCHAQPSCRTCHTGSLGERAIDALPRGGPGSLPGVQLRHAPVGPVPPSLGVGASLSQVGLPARRAAVVDTPPVGRVDVTRTSNVRVHTVDFPLTHGPIAATGRLDCAGCHQQRFCTACHQGTGERRYHQFNFVARHPAEANARETNCASCHNTEVFCRSCHVEVAGIGAGSKRRAGAAHAGQPLWLLQHGEAARRGMQTCSTCHQQTDCMQCHSSAGGRINPHGPNFNAAQMRARNPTLCSYCHLTTPR